MESQPNFTSPSSPGRAGSGVVRASASTPASGSTPVSPNGSGEVEAEQQQPQPSSPLDSDLGRTTIADGVVAKVAHIACREVPGVYELGAAPSRALNRAGQAVGVSDPRTQGVSVEVGTREVAVDVVVVIEWGESIPQVAQEIRDNVVQRMEGLCGLIVKEVNIDVRDLHFAGDDEPAESRLN